MNLIIVLVLFFSFSSWAEVYKRGKRSCDFASAEEYYKQDSKDIGNQVYYAHCLIIKGEDSKGLSMLYHLADHKSSHIASFFLALYLETDGDLKNHPNTRKSLNQAIKYYLRTKAIISLIPQYPMPDYIFHEREEQMELKSIRSVVYLYLEKYKFGAIGDFRRHQLQSPSYTGERNKTLFSEYNSFMLDSLEKMAYHAGECANLPQKRHFDPAIYRKTIKVCNLSKELAVILRPLEIKRQEILLQTNCQDLTKTKCPEYYETHTKIHELIVDYAKTYISI